MIKRQAKKTKTQKQALTQKPSQTTGPQDELTFLEHLYELRARIFWIISSLIVTSAIGYYIKDILVAFVIAPLHGEKLVYLTPGGGFSFIFTICLYFGALLTIPVIMYHLYRFLQPVLGKASRRLIVAIILLSSTLAASGAAFGYLVAIPAAIEFLSTFAGDAVMPNLTAESYLGFVVAYMLGLAALFQLPLLLFIIDHVRPFPPGSLLSSQRFVIVGAMIAAAIITPTPDIINQLIVAGPIILIYQFGALAVFMRRKVGQRKNARAEQRASCHLHHRETASTVTPAVIPESRVQLPDREFRSRPVAKSVDGLSRPPQRPVSASRANSSALKQGRQMRSTDGFIASS